MDDRQSPSFKTPPVIEVALGIRFTPLPDLDAAHIGWLWSQHWKKSYPITEEQPPVEHLPAEESDRDTESGPSLARMWFLNPHRTSLIQVQNDGFVHNWQKKTEGPEPYPRYKTIRKTFEMEFEKFKSFIEEHGLGVLQVKRAEVTYVNQIRPEGWKTHSDLANISPLWRGEYSDGFLPCPKDIAFHVRHDMGNDNGNPEGALNVTLLPGFSKKPRREPVYRLTLAAQAAPDGSDSKSVLRCLDLGHRWVVNGFVSVTSPQMHTIWEKE